MNIVDLIKSNLSGETLNQLGSWIGASPEQTRTAATAAVPSMLAGMSKLAGSKDGADRLSSILENLDPELIKNLGVPGTSPYAGKKPADLDAKSGSMLDQILPGGMTSGLGGLLEKFTGMGGGLIKKLLSYLAPLILGTIAKHMGGKLSGQGLSQFFSEQQQNITNAMPPGFSLASIPGMGDVSRMAQKAGDTVKQGANQLSWLLPLLLLLFIAAIIYYFFFLDKPAIVPTKPGPAPQTTITMDPSTSLQREIGTFFSTATQSLESVKDAASAETALPKLNELIGKVDGMKTAYTGLPDAGKTAVKALLTSGLEKLKALITKLTALPGVGEKLKPVTDQLLAKLSAFTS